MWDARCQLGPKFNAKLGYDVLLVLDAYAVDIAVGLCGGALYASRDGVVAASVTIPCAETLSQVIVMGQPAHQRPANNLVIFDARFKSPEATAMAVGDSIEAAKAHRSPFVIPVGAKIAISANEALCEDAESSGVCDGASRSAVGQAFQGVRASAGSV